MLNSLYIENIAVVEKAEIDFHNGFNVLSGETGAGKSIIIDSINAILGGRVSRELIRTGEKRAVVAAGFSAVGQKALDYCAEQGISSGSNEIIIRREMYSDGRNNCKINGSPASLSMLKAVGALLINIHGQHDGQNLLNDENHIEYLDSFGGLESILAEYHNQYERLLQLNKRIKTISMSEQNREKHIAWLEQCTEELTAANIKPNEQAELLEQRLTLLGNQNITEALAGASAFVDGNGDEPGAIDLLSQAEGLVRSAQKYGGVMEAVLQQTTDVISQINDLSSEISAVLMANEYSPEALEETEQRLELISKLCKKHSCSANELEALNEDLLRELNSVRGDNLNLDELNAQYIEQRGKVSDLAGRLHSLREQAGETMRAQIESELHLLDMPSARFCAEISTTMGQSQAKFTKRGTDIVRFLLSTNTGEELKPLTKVASGGELSRIMLAIKAILSKTDQGVTAIFDEIDTGVSGRAASRVGEKLLDISKDRQVLCVTHLPQIAALADHQFYIEKNEDSGRTYTSVTHLNEAGRINELARLIAGVHVSEATLASARQLLKSAEISKK